MAPTDPSSNNWLTLPTSNKTLEVYLKLYSNFRNCRQMCRGQDQTGSKIRAAMVLSCVFEMFTHFYIYNWLDIVNKIIHTRKKNIEGLLKETALKLIVAKKGLLSCHMHHRHAGLLPWQPDVIISVCTTQRCFLVYLTQQQTPHSNGWELKTECTLFFFFKKSTFLFTLVFLFLLQCSFYSLLWMPLECHFVLLLYAIFISIDSCVSWSLKEFQTFPMVVSCFRYTEQILHIIANTQ